MNNSKLILIVEDEIKMASLLSDYLSTAGFRCHCLYSGVDVEAWYNCHLPDLVLLDLMLPDKDGLTVCREIRSQSDVPIIMVTARIEEIDRLLGLELGADDYICKPFSLREVVARVKAVLRRSVATNDTNIKTPPIELDEAKFLAKIKGKKLDLTPVEFRLLSTLSTHPGRVFSRAQLINSAYVDYRVVSDRTVDSHIKNLRKKLAVVSPLKEWIESVYGVGYRFNDEFIVE